MIFEDVLAAGMVVIVSVSLSDPAGVVFPYLELEVVLVLVAVMALCFAEFADSAVVAVVPPVSEESG